MSLPTAADFELYLKIYENAKGPENNLLTYAVEKSIRTVLSTFTSLVSQMPTNERKIKKISEFREKFKGAQTAEQWLEIAIELGEQANHSQETKMVRGTSDFCNTLHAMRTLILSRLGEVENSVESTTYADAIKIRQAQMQQLPVTLVKLKNELLTLESEQLTLQKSLAALAADESDEKRIELTRKKTTNLADQAELEKKIKHNEDTQKKLPFELANLGLDESIISPTVNKFFIDIRLEFPSELEAPRTKHMSGVSPDVYPKLGRPLCYQKKYFNDFLFKHTESSQINPPALPKSSSNVNLSVDTVASPLSRNAMLRNTLNQTTATPKPEIVTPVVPEKKSAATFFKTAPTAEEKKWLKAEKAKSKKEKALQKKLEQERLSSVLFST
jgi:hypothetical protein